MPNETSIPEDVKEIINNILAEEEKAKIQKELEEGGLERLYIWDHEEEPEDEEKSKTTYISMV